MSNIFYLNLPAVPDKLADRLIAGCKLIEINQERLNRCKNRFTYPAPVAAQEYGNENGVMSQDLIEELRSLYGKLFKGGIISVYGLAKNVAGLPSLTPPHTDRSRRVAINYLLQTGGTNVTTTFYAERNSDDADLSVSRHLPYEQATVESKVILLEKKWHCFNAQQLHSVENIETERYYLSLVLIHNNSYEDFINYYSHLLINDK
jgi:hypothetical protein